MAIRGFGGAGPYPRTAINSANPNGNQFVVNGSHPATTDHLDMTRPDD